MIVEKPKYNTFNNMTPQFSMNIRSWDYEHLRSLSFEIDVLQTLIVLSIVIIDGVFWFVKFLSYVGSCKDELVCIIVHISLLNNLYTNSCIAK